MIFKFHHSFCDGVSVMSMNLALSSEYNSTLVENIDGKIVGTFLSPWIGYGSLLNCPREFHDEKKRKD